MATQAVADEVSLPQVALLFAGVSLVGASLGWFLMSSYFLTADQTIGADSPAVMAESDAMAARASYYLQVAAYTQEDGARLSAESLEEFGFEVQIQNDGLYHRLLVGPLESLDAVGRTRESLANVLQNSTNVKRSIPEPWLTVQPPKK